MLKVGQMVVLRWSPAEALHPIANLELVRPPVPGVPAQSARQRPFRDAGYARADFHLSVQDCLFGIKKAVDLRLLRLDEFDVKEYEHYEKVENGDWNVGFSSGCLAGPLTQATVCQPALPCLCVARRGALQPDRLP
jgi:hypothetical protein